MNADKQICRMLGLQPLHLAALVGDTEQISKIAALTPGFDINTPVCAKFAKPITEVSWPRGETPLMLASMMGHIKTVEMIIFHGARVDQEDDNSCTAARFYTSELATKTHRDFYLSRGLGKESPDAVNIRHAIGDYLNSDFSHNFTQRPGDSGYMPILLSKHSRKLVASAPFAKVNIGKTASRQKEIGCLKIFNDYNIHLWASSGYRPKAEGADDKYLDGRKLCDIARKCIAPIIRFKFAKSKHDHSRKHEYTPDMDGRSKASHVECQLSTAFVLQLANENYAGTDKTVAEKLKLLRSSKLGNKRNAVIYITSMPCRSCDVYLNRLSTYTGVNFKVLGDSGNAQVRREKGKYNQLQDVYYDRWQDSDGEDEDSNFVCIKCRGNGSNNQTPSPTCVAKLTEPMIVIPPIVISDSDEEYDSEDTLSDAASEKVRPSSPLRQVPLLVSDIIHPEVTPSEPSPPPARNHNFSPVVQRELSDPLHIPLRMRRNPALLTSNFLSTLRRSTSASSSPAVADDTPSVSREHLQRDPALPGQMLPKYAEIASKGPKARKEKVTRGREGTDSSYEPVRRYRRAKPVLVQPPHAPDVYSVPLSRDMSQVHSRAVSRSLYSRVPSVRPPTPASLKQQIRVRKAEKRKKRAGARTRGNAAAFEGKIAPPTKSFRGAGLDLEEFRCRG